MWKNQSQLTATLFKKLSCMSFSKTLPNFTTSQEDVTAGLLQDLVLMQEVLEAVKQTFNVQIKPIIHLVARQQINKAVILKDSFS